MNRMNDLINRQMAIDALGDEPEVWSGKDEYELGLNNQWHYDVNALKALPSAKPKTCEGCKHLGKWKNEVEYGCPSPCTFCKRRVADNYEKENV